MNVRSNLLSALLAPILLAPGCLHPVSTPPVTLSEYEQMQTATGETYPPFTIVLYNLRRGLDRELTTTQRIASLRLALHLGGKDLTVLDHLAPILDDPESPPSLRLETLTRLLESDYPGIARYVVQALPHVQKHPPLRVVVLEWLGRRLRLVEPANIARPWEIAQVPGADKLLPRSIPKSITRQESTKNTPQVHAPGGKPPGKGTPGRRISPEMKPGG